MITIHFSRDSVCAADDTDAHGHSFTIPAPTDLLPFTTSILKHAHLATISGGKATWCLSARIPFAVAAQQWPNPKPLPGSRLSICVPPGVNAVAVHASYFAQQDPDQVFDILRRLALPV